MLRFLIFLFFLAVALVSGQSCVARREWDVTLTIKTSHSKSVWRQSEPIIKKVHYDTTQLQTVAFFVGHSATPHNLIAQVLNEHPEMLVADPVGGLHTRHFHQLAQEHYNAGDTGHWIMNDFYNRIDSSTVDRSSTKVLVGDVHADVVSQAMLKNATVVCNFLQRLASECDVWLTMIYVTRNPLDNIADRFRRTKRRKTEKMLNDVFVDHWLDEAMAVDTLRKCANVDSEQTLHIDVDTLRTDTANTLRSWCAFFALDACPQSWLDSGVETLRAELGKHVFVSTSDNGADVAPSSLYEFTPAQSERLYTAVKSHEFLQLYAKELSRAVRSSTTPSAALMDNALKEPVVCGAKKNALPMLVGPQGGRRLRMSGSLRKKLFANTLVIICDTKHLNYTQLFQPLFPHVFCAQKDPSDMAYQELPDLPIWWIRDKHWRWISYLRERFANDPPFVPPLIILGALHHSFYCNMHDDYVFDAQLPLPIVDVRSTAVTISPVESVFFYDKCVRPAITTHLKFVPSVENGIELQDFSVAPDCSEWLVEGKVDSMPALTVFAGGYSDRDYPTLITAVTAAPGVVLRIFFDPSKYIHANRNETLALCQDAGPKCQLISDATRERYVDAMRCHNIVAVPLTPDHPWLEDWERPKLLSGLTTLVEALGTRAVVLVTSRRAGEWAYYVPHRHTVDAAGGVSAWRQALRTLSLNRNHLASFRNFWNVRQKMFFNIETQVNNMMDVFVQAVNEIDCDRVADGPTKKK